MKCNGAVIAAEAEVGEERTVRAQGSATDRKEQEQEQAKDENKQKALFFLDLTSRVSCHLCPN